MLLLGFPLFGLRFVVALIDHDWDGVDDCDVPNARLIIGKFTCCAHSTVAFFEKCLSRLVNFCRPAVDLPGQRLGVARRGTVGLYQYPMKEQKVEKVLCVVRTVLQARN